MVMLLMAMSGKSCRISGNGFVHLFESFLYMYVVGMRN